MDCIAPPALADAQLLAYLDGEADSRVIDHVARCPHCRARARRLARIEQRLATGLYRATCPAAGDLGEYHLGLLPRGQAAAIAHHLADCPHCAHELAQLDRFLGDLRPEPQTGLAEQIGERLRVLWASLVPPQRDLAWAGVRGEPASATVYQAGPVELTLSVQENVDRPERRDLLGLVTGVEGEALEADLWQAGQLAASAPVDAGYNFVLPELAPGHYELVLRGATLEVHIPDLTI